MSRRLLLSLHDVSPFHVKRCDAAERVFVSLGVKKIAYLLVPHFHAHSHAVDARFMAWCLKPRPFEVEWVLHGYYHLEGVDDAAPRPREGWTPAVGAEAEFGTLEAEHVERRIAAGAEVFERVIGHRPAGFVPPAWRWNEALPPALAAHRIGWYEDAQGLYDLRRPRPRLDAPVVTWATRTPLRKALSIAGTPVLERLWRSKPLVRLAVHPYDFDHPSTVQSIGRVWLDAVFDGTQHTYAEVLA